MFGLNINGRLKRLQNVPPSEPAATGDEQDAAIQEYVASLPDTPQVRHTFEVLERFEEDYCEEHGIESWAGLEGDEEAEHSLALIKRIRSTEEGRAALDTITTLPLPPE